MAPRQDRIQTTTPPNLDTLPIDFNVIRREAYAGVEWQDDAQIAGDTIDAIDAFEEYTNQYILEQTLEARFASEEFYYKRALYLPLDLPGLEARVTGVTDNGTGLVLGTDYRVNVKPHKKGVALWPMRCWSGNELVVTFTAGIAPDGTMPRGIEKTLGVWVRTTQTGAPADHVLFYSLCDRYMV